MRIMTREQRVTKINGELVIDENAPRDTIGIQDEFEDLPEAIGTIEDIQDKVVKAAAFVKAQNDIRLKLKRIMVPEGETSTMRLKYLV